LPSGLLLLGGFIELAQAASGWRQGDWLDLLADATVILAVMIAWHLFRARSAQCPTSAGD
jgi:hypothetical protein